MTASLLVVQGRNQGQRITLDGDLLELGRGNRSGFRILDTEVSRSHATIRRRTAMSGGSDPAWEIVDRGSSNGTFVNGQVVEQAALTGGDHVQVGRTVLLFQDGSDEAVEDQTVADQVDLAAGDFGQDSIVAQVDGEPSEAMLSHVRSGAATDAALRTNLEVLYQVSELVVRPSVSVDDLLSGILGLSLKAIGADRGVMLVADPQTDEIRPRVFGRQGVVTPAGDDAGDRMPISRTIVDYVLTRGRGVLTSDAAGDERFAGHESILSSGIREAMCVPMHGRFELLGVIYVDTTQAPGQAALHGQRFGSESLMLLAAVGRQAALAVENHRYQDALVKAERLAAVGQTVAMLSHHVKNILQGMRGGGYLVESGLKKNNDEMARRGWGILDRNQNRLYNLVMDMLAFSKERVPELQPCSLNEIVADVADLMQPAAAEQSIAIRVDLSEEMLVTEADPEALHRAVLNLVVNAIEAMDDRDDGEVMLRTVPPSQLAGDEVAIEVRDNGPGVPAEARPRLFAMFESSKGSRGTGIGLAVAKKILEEHGGEIDVESSTTPPTGTTFRLRLPFRSGGSGGDSLRQTGEIEIPLDLSDRSPTPTN